MAWLSGKERRAIGSGEAGRIRREHRNQCVLLVVEFYGTLNGSITNDIAMCKILGKDATAGFLLLGNVVRITVRAGGMRGSIVGLTSGGDNDLRRIELSVVEELGRLGSSLLLESYRGILGPVAGLGDL